jgi:hypothetical protein
MLNGMQMLKLECAAIHWTQARHPEQKYCLIDANSVWLKHNMRRHSMQKQRALHTALD